jgi:hypothetical protein
MTLKGKTMNNITSALFTDFYELTMAQGYWKENMNQEVVFDMFFRSNPSGNGYSVCAGLEQVINYIKNLHFTAEDIEYATLKEVGDQYFITIAFNDLTSAEAQDVLTKAFDLRDKEEILASEEFAKTKEYLVLNDYDVVYSGCKITATVNRLTNEITNINYYKAADVTAYMTGKGTVESYGEISVMFTLEDRANYDINWTNDLPTSPLETATEAAQ